MTHTDRVRARRSTARRRSHLILAGHAVQCAQWQPIRPCRACYGDANEHGEVRPRTIEAAYANLSQKALAMMGRRR